MKSRVIRLGNLLLGGGNPVLVQTMTKSDTRSVFGTLQQIKSAAALGAEIVRVAVPDRRAAEALKEICADSPVPLVADIHFNAALAVLSLKNGAKGVRINPGNIGGLKKVREVAEAAGKAGAALRVGVNMGSLDKEIEAEFGRTPRAMAESALKDSRAVLETGFQDVKVSLKASSVMDTVEAARLFSSLSDLPQHLGVTEAGDLLSGAAKSGAALGMLLSEGIGDTVRVSLTGAPEDEVRAAWEILRALNLRSRGIEFISCPTCARCEIDLCSLSADVKRRLSDVAEPLRIAVMGCIVNGPGEAGDADLGIAGGKRKGTLFVKGEKFKELPYESLASELERQARRLASEREGLRKKSQGEAGGA